MIDLDQFQDRVINPTLDTIGMASPGARRILLVTGMIESGYEHLVQVGGGPALSFWQIERATHRDQYINYLFFKFGIRNLFLSLVSPESADTPDGVPEHDELLFNMRYAVAIARLKYYRSTMVMPLPDDINGMCNFYLKVYNAGGKSTQYKFLKAWRQCGLPGVSDFELKNAQGAPK